MRTPPPGLGDRGFLTTLLVSAVLHVVVFGIARMQLDGDPPPEAIAVELEPLGGGGFENAPDKPLPPLPAAGGAPEPAPTAAEPEASAEPEATPEPPARPDDAVVAKPEAKPKPKPKAVEKAKPAEKPKKTEKPKAPDKPADKTTDAGAKAEGKGGSGDSSDGLADIRQLLEARKGSGGGQGAGGGSSREFGVPDGVQGRLYFRSVDAAIRSVWAVPPGSKRTPVEVEIVIGADGRLIAQTLRASSGDVLLDRSATGAIERATLPPPPVEFRTPLKLILRLIPSEE